MNRQLFSVPALAAQLNASNPEVTDEQLQQTVQQITQAAVTLDLPYELSLDNVWYFATPAIARIREALGT